MFLVVAQVLVELVEPVEMAEMVEMVEMVGEMISMTSRSDVVARRTVMADLVELAVLILVDLQPLVVVEQGRRVAATV